jgi:hypothetical protein
LESYLPGVNQADDTRMKEAKIKAPIMMRIPLIINEARDGS